MPPRSPQIRIAVSLVVVGVLCLEIESTMKAEDMGGP